MKPTLKDLVAGNRKAKFSKYRAGYFYYTIKWTNESPEESMGVPKTWEFCIPIDDIDGATLNKEEKSINLMRWIGKAIKEDTLIEVK